MNPHHYADANLQAAREQRGRSWQQFEPGRAVLVDLGGRPRPAAVTRMGECSACAVVHVVWEDGTAYKVTAERVRYA